MSTVIIVNPVAGGARLDQGRRRAELAAGVLAARGTDGEVVITERRGQARELAAAAAARGARLVIAWGGDGTVNEVASALVHRPTALGIVPAGSGNGLARDLGVARRAERAIAEALAAMPRPIDAGELGGRLFFSVAGIGFDAHVAACFDLDGIARRGFSSYVRIALRELMTYRAGDYRLDCVGGRPVRGALLVVLANSSQFGNGACIAPQARLDDGRLDLVVFEERSRFATLCSAPRLFTGGVARMRGVTMRQVERAAIEADQPLTFHVDGEPARGGTRLEGRVLPAAIRVAVR
jgi:diacylglycerol kinase (ATP)